MQQASVFEKAAMLASLPLFAPLSDAQNAQLAEHCLWQHWPKNHSLFQAGEKAHGVHIVLQGLVKIFHTTPDGRERVLHLIKAPGTCGEAAVFQRGTYPAHASTLAPSTVLYVPAEALLDMLIRNPHLALNMLAALSLRLRMFTRKLEAHSTTDASARLAAYILHRARLGNSSSLKLEVSREVLANMLGIARETLSRALSRLQQSGSIDVAGRTIHIRDLQSLQQAADSAIDVRC